jgi:hypothetical protein
MSRAQRCFLKSASVILAIASDTDVNDTTIQRTDLEATDPSLVFYTCKHQCTMIELVIRSRLHTITLTLSFSFQEFHRGTHSLPSSVSAQSSVAAMEGNPCLYYMIINRITLPKFSLWPSISRSLAHE